MTDYHLVHFDHFYSQKYGQSAEVFQLLHTSSLRFSLIMKYYSQNCLTQPAYHSLSSYLISV